MLAENTPFPDFSLPDQDGNTVTLADLKGKPALIYFYPKDDTPGCTVEACDFQARLAQLEGVRVLGVSPDSPKKHVKFRTKFNLEFTLLSDEAHTLLEAAGLWVEKKLYGRPYMGVARTTVLLDSDGVVKKLWTNVNPNGHADAVLAALQ